MVEVVSSTPAEVVLLPGTPVGLKTGAVPEETALTLEGLTGG